MILNITDVLTTEGKTEQREITFTPPVLQYGKDQYVIDKKYPVFLTVVNTGKGRAQITGNMEVSVLFACDRCLKEVSYPFSLEFSTAVTAPEFGAAVSEEEESLTGYEFDVDELVYHEILVNWPMKILCRPDCRGICSVCGKDLNEGACACDTFVPDPRLAAIKDIFNAGKEV